MSIFDRVSQFLALAPLQEPEPSALMSAQHADASELKARIAASFTVSDGINDILIGGSNSRPWTLPSINDALGVPSIQRAVSLISGTVGMLSLQAYRNGVPTDTPRQIARPDPYSIPRDTYRDLGWCMSTRGEVVLCIMSRDADGIPNAFSIVPPRELTVEENPNNRLFPRYKWGDIQDTRFSAANPSGRFLHITYLKEPGALRGIGPLQMCRAAVSVSVEAQEWAASFFADGGLPSILIRSNVPLSGDKNDPDFDPDEKSEAERFRDDWMSKPHNTPRVVDDMVGPVEQFAVNEQGAQMLQARDYNNGDAARMFGIPGVLLEYSVQGSSLTYQNIADVYTLWVKSSLAPNYLEPIEQWLSDTLPRSMVVRFDVEGLLRADALTRFQIYQLAIQSGIYDSGFAAAKEGITPGGLETAPIAPAPPAAVPSSIPQMRTAAAVADRVEVRCDGMAQKKIGGVYRLERCNKLLAEKPPFTGTCRRCGKVFSAVA